MRPPLDSSAHSTPSTLAFLDCGELHKPVSKRSFRPRNERKRGRRTPYLPICARTYRAVPSATDIERTPCPVHLTARWQGVLRLRGRFAKHPLRSKFVTFSKLPKIDAANKAVTTTKSSKIQKVTNSQDDKLIERPHTSSLKPSPHTFSILLAMVGGLHFFGAGRGVVTRYVICPDRAWGQVALGSHWTPEPEQLCAAFQDSAAQEVSPAAEGLWWACVPPLPFSTGTPAIRLQLTFLSSPGCGRPRRSRCRGRGRRGLRR